VSKDDQPLIVIEFTGQPYAFTKNELAAARTRAADLGFGARSDAVQVEGLVDAEQLAAIVNVPQSWLEEAARQEKIPSVLAGRYRRFRPSAVIAALSNHRN
jgi:ABC-type Na+ efflux pump permease subunit